jgi:hypothetical protein
VAFHWLKRLLGIHVPCWNVGVVEAEILREPLAHILKDAVEPR